MAIPTLALKSPAVLACITEGRAYPALEPARDTAVELDVHAEVGWNGLARGMRGAPFVPVDSKPQ